MTAMTFLDVNRFNAARLASDPFPHLVVKRFVRPELLSDLVHDFPAISAPGSYPVNVVDFGPAFGALVNELERPFWTVRFAQKFGVELAGRPTMVTVRGVCRARDGQIHTDTESKLVTALMYLNPEWNAEGGRLRLLRSRHSLEDYVAEVSPSAGNLVAFVNGSNAWHGHKSYTGVRRSLQLNWVTDARTVRRELRRHRWSAAWKQIAGVFKGSVP